VALHSELGASKAERWMQCPGSVNAERGLFSPPSPYAIEGTAAHILCEKCLRKGIDADVYLDTEIPVEVETEQGKFETQHIAVTEEMAEAVQVYVDFVRKRTGPLRMIEVQFNLAPLNPPEPMFGTSDCVDWNAETKFLEVFDFKYGAGVAVDAEENVQLCYYALGAVVALNKKPEKIRVNIIQPRAAHKDGIIRSFEFGWDYLINYKKQLFAAAVKTQAEDAPRKAGAHCRFCKALAVCPAQRAQAVEVAQSEFDVEATPNLPVVTNLTDEEIGKILTAAPFIEDWLKAVRSHVTAILDRGGSVPGWKLVPKRASRKWKDDEQVKRVLELMAGITKDDLYREPKFVSPAQAEALLKEKKIKYDLSAYIIKASSGTNLAPESDVRPALMPSAQSDFEADLEQVLEESIKQATESKTTEATPAAPAKKRTRAKSAK
jgi:hypothetical protein